MNKTNLKKPCHVILTVQYPRGSGLYSNTFEGLIESHRATERHIYEAALKALREHTGYHGNDLAVLFYRAVPNE